MKVSLPSPREPIADEGGLINRAWYGFLTQLQRASITTSADPGQTLYTVATLPDPAVGAGTSAFVTDATATTFSSVVVGGGTNRVPCYSDGSAWRIG